MHTRTQFHCLTLRLRLPASWKRYVQQWAERLCTVHQTQRNQWNRVIRAWNVRLTGALRSHHKSLIGKPESRRPFESHHKSLIGKPESRRPFESHHKRLIGKPESRRPFERHHKSLIGKPESRRQFESHHKSLIGKPESRRPFERLKRRWDDNIKVAFKEINVRVWNKFMRMKDALFFGVNAVKNVGTIHGGEDCICCLVKPACCLRLVSLHYVLRVKTNSAFTSQTARFVCW
jgi:hypothetical protein